MSAPVICFGQQPCGIFPRRFLFAKFQTARRLQREIGGRIVFFYHDSDHDPRETTTILRDRRTGAEARLNFQCENKLQRQFSPLYRKRLCPGWQEKTGRQLPNYVAPSLVDAFHATRAENVADFCLQMYAHMGLLDGVETQRSSDPEFRRRAAVIEEYFVDVEHENEVVRARRDGERLLLHKGGEAYLELPWQTPEPTQISPTRDSRLRWMQSVIQCTHYVTGAGELQYLNTADAPEIEFVRRDDIRDSDHAYVTAPGAGMTNDE